MNYADEDYVRLYTRDTVTWKLLGWEARTVLLHMLKGKFDRSGIFVTGSHATSRSVTAVTGLPTEVVERGLEELMSEGVWTQVEGALVWPTYVDAQNTPRTDAARKREERARNNKEKLNKERESRSVTPGHASVTDGHAESHDVTKCHPSLAEPSQAEDLSSTSSPEPTKADERSAIVRRVFETWKLDTGHHAAKLTDDRKRKILGRLREGYTEQDLLDAIEGRHRDPWLMGEDPKSTKVYDGIETLFKSGGQVEKLRDLKRGTAGPTNGAGHTVTAEDFE